VAGSIDPLHADPEKANLQLSEGLKTCRLVMNNYRAMVLGVPQAANDRSPDHDPWLIDITREP
jgi:hypothetical protein